MGCVRIETLIERAGLASARFFIGMEFDNDLLTVLVERWRRETHTFYLLEGEATITLNDVALLIDFLTLKDASIVLSSV
ncbi:unnamed protein product [Linum trigynum]|uniref:Aminotransferase-like plant mobile domain-containing protein n=1 Tax=Linum trigynum TaxID=586398 RepID=A0AAV2CHT0_9ROSI